MEFYKISNEITKANEWFWKQVEATIRTIFHKYNFEFPKYVLIEETDHLITLKIIRPNIDTLEEAIKWEENKVYLLDELSSQAEVNSTDEYDDEDYVKYKFEIL